MSAKQVELLDGPLSPSITLEQNDKTVDEQLRLDNPNAQLSTIAAALDDKMKNVRERETKKEVIEAALAEIPIPDQDIEMRTYSDPEEKIEQITEVIQNDTLHIHEQFSSIQAILGQHTNSNNPWIQAHQALVSIENSSRELIKAEEKRQKEKRKAWKKEMEGKGDQYYREGKDQRRWQLVMAGVASASTICLIGSNLAQEGGKIATYLNTGADLLKNGGTQFIKQEAELSQIYAKQDETLLDWSSAQERQDLENQGQVVQEARQNDNSLKERHLEIIRTLTGQIIGH